jgi:hypothetical protein
LCRASLTERSGSIEWDIRTPRGEADLNVIARIAEGPAPVPEGSPFLSSKDARKFAGPLPYTFDYEPETHSIIRIRGVRQVWNPMPVAVEVRENTFLKQKPFRDATPILANAFYLRDVPYRWERGTLAHLEGE